MTSTSPAPKPPQLAPGVEVFQITHGDALVSNIYCERPFSSDDNKSFIFWRQTDARDSAGQSVWELVRCTFGSWELDVVAAGRFSNCVSYQNDFYLPRLTEKQTCEVLRVDRSSGESQVVCTYDDARWAMNHPTASSDGRWLAFGTPVSYQPQRFGIALFDLQTGEQKLTFEHPDIWNSHLQFHPTDPNTLLVQVNRGAIFRPDGTWIRKFDKRGTTAMILDIAASELRPLNIGKPHTERVTGHEAWLGRTREVIATVTPQGPFAAENGGNVVCVAEDGPWRQLPTGEATNHIGTTFDGSYFFADHQHHDRILIGSPRTGRCVVVHHDPDDTGECPFGQQSHPHAYLTEDHKWMVFNSDRTGRPQVYVASIPDGLLDDLD